ncbi:MAG TPA: winged helix-turn-helix domain-containing protein [Bryobacteraceae bacterium]|nr:winged helix-turn-helix domain-containing protein [Bryobacteraceae bacterium]
MIRKKREHFFEFGRFRLDPVERVLYAGGQPVPLTLKAFETLLALVENSGHVVPKDELLKRVWPDTFVEEGTLVQNIATLRRALSDGADQRSPIETVPRRGYRFSATVNQVDADEPVVEPKSRQAYRTVVRAAMATVLLVAVWFGVEGRRSPAPQREKIRLAVLPFVNLSGDPGQDYFSNGLTEEMITQLGSLEPARLAVIARTSSMQYKDTRKDARRIGRELGVDYIMEGSVRRDAGRVRITAKLIRVNDQTNLWAQDYDRNLTDILSLQNDVTSAIAAEIRLKLTPAASARAANAVPLDPKVLEMYLEGRYFWNKRTESGILRAIDYFNQAIARAPRYAQAYAGLADAYALLGSLANATMPRPEAMTKAKASALQALEIDDSLAEAHTSLAFVLMQYEWDWPGSEREFQRALELNPNYATAHQWYGFWLMARGRSGEALDEERRAQENDPLSTIVETDTCQLLTYLGRNDEAIRHAQRALELDPGFPLAHLYLAEAFAGKKEYQEAILEAGKALDLNADPTWAQSVRARIYALAGQTDQTQAILQKLLRAASPQDGRAMVVAQVYAALGEKDAAFEWLENAYRQREGGLILLQVASAFQPIHQDPRFSDLVRRIGLRYSSS